MLPSFRRLTLAEQVAQMIVVRASGHLFDQQIRYPRWEAPTATLRRWIEQVGIGGVIMLGGSAAELALRTQQMQAWASVPLLVAADVEEGVGQRFAGGTWFPPPMALQAVYGRSPDKALQLAEQMGRAIAQEALAVGLNWVLAPVVDVNNNANNPVINVRAFGDTPAVVSKLAAAFLRGTQPHPVLTCAKHFPGHGDTATDSHLTLPLVAHSAQRLDAVELVPFRRAIAAGVDSVMTAHLLVSAWDTEHPATLSRRCLTDELRQNLGFDGLVVTDALVMGAIAQQYSPTESALRAVEAGADILLMPAEPEPVIQSLCDAVQAGRIEESRIEASLERIWRAKQRVQSPPLSPSSAYPHGTSHAWEQMAPPPVDAATLTTHLAQPQAIATATTLLQESMTVRVSSPLLQSRALDSSKQTVILVDDLLSCAFLGHEAPAIARPAAFGYRLHLADQQSPVTCDPQPTLLQLFIRGNPFRASSGLIRLAQDWVRSLHAASHLEAVVIYGSPYVLEALQPLVSADIPLIFSYGQMHQAQAIALDQLFTPAPYPLPTSGDFGF
ncbi:MAG: beta-glucosidase [Kaiparowitsia implicata GSE-PSE-MK54-09C]|jgi:beta-glucosidase|nr:beta-glucosidase [Kaiparowitsia implicata GSE-PSE-MK54-09C]